MNRVTDIHAEVEIIETAVLAVKNGGADPCPTCSADMHEVWRNDVSRRHPGPGDTLLILSPHWWPMAHQFGVRPAAEFFGIELKVAENFHNFHTNPERGYPGSVEWEGPCETFLKLKAFSEEQRQFSNAT